MLCRKDGAQGKGKGIREEDVAGLVEEVRRENKALRW
jgi:hypothetical protein